MKHRRAGSHAFGHGPVTQPRRAPDHRRGLGVVEERFGLCVEVHKQDCREAPGCIELCSSLRRFGKGRANCQSDARVEHGGGGKLHGVAASLEVRADVRGRADPADADEPQL